MEWHVLNCSIHAGFILNIQNVLEIQLRVSGT